LSTGRDDLIDLVQRVAKRDGTALAALYDRTSAKLFGIVIRILRQNALAEEVLQETYLRIWRKASTYDPALASPITWMVTIARNLAIDTARKSPERVAAASDDLDAAEIDLAPATDGGDDVLAAGRLRRCLGELDGHQREMVVLAYCHGLTRAELAARFERPVNTVKTMLRRTLSALKRCLDGEN